MKPKQYKKIISSVLSFLLIITMVLSFSSSYVFAEQDIFIGTEPLEAEENQVIDLLQGVTATSPTGENLKVIVHNVICETDENYQYDDSGILKAGKAGAVYHIEYEAVSSVNAEETYSTTREVTVISKENLPSEEVPGTSPEQVPNNEVEETPNDSTQELPNKNLDISQGTGTQILFENGIHYIVDPQYPDKKITLFCMNNKLHWPHHTEDMGNLQVPGYTEGYLTPDDFQSQEEYDECMRRLSKLLYAGYPYNGERLYKIVEDSKDYAPTEEEFNKMLIVPPVLQTAYPYLEHHKFTYADWKNQDKEHLEELRKFVDAVIKLNIYGGTTSNGLTYTDISSMPFYKAAWSIINCNNDTPLVAFQFYYGASYFVTEEEAYNATQNAVWHLLYEYGIPDNDIDSLNSKLCEVLYTYSERGGLLDYRPSSDEIEVLGDLDFTYNPKTGMWHSGTLRIMEPDVYRGLYRLELPKGITALCDNLNYVYGNEEYELVSDHQPTVGESFGIQAEFVWLEEFKQYSPSPDIEFQGKKFQHMIGAIIHNETVHIAKGIGAKNVGDIAITKKVVGETGNQNDFHFTLRLPYHDEINGLYGDLEFHKGVAEFTLKDGGIKKATNLPAGAYFVVEEERTSGYQIGVTKPIGEVPISDVVQVTFTNTKLPDLSLSKTVTGELGDKTKQFEFVISLKDKNGRPVNKTYDYVGSVKEGSGAEKPADGRIKFTKGEAKISLSHGQKITIKDLPYGATYTVKETKDEKDPYITKYNGQTTHTEGKLDTDYSIKVENHKENVPSTGIKHTNNHSAGIGVAISLVALVTLLFGCLLHWRRGLKK